MTVPPADVKHLRPALQFVLQIVQQSHKVRRAIDVPEGLAKYLKLDRITTAQLPAVRRIVEGDDEFRRKIAAGAVPELVDPIGILWLQRPEGWESEVERLVAEAEAAVAEAALAAELKKANKRRERAEAVAVRTRAELVALAEQLDGATHRADELAGRVETLEREVAEHQAALTAARTEARHARDRELAALRRLDEATGQTEAAQRDRAAAERVRDDALAERNTAATDRAELARLVGFAESLAARLAALSGPDDDEGAPRPRTPLSLPGGVLGDSVAAARYLLRSGASILVDGYNVAKLAWPDRTPEEERRLLLDELEHLVKRHGADIAVVFDGADVVGAHASRRSVLRVVFSPADVEADDVIRDEVRRLPPSRPVVVVTGDQAIVRDVKKMGANVLASSQLISLFV